MNTIKERLLFLMPTLGYKSMNHFDRGLGLSRNTITSYCGENATKEPSTSFYKKLLAVHPNIDINWIITGEGNYTRPDWTFKSYVDGLKNELELEKRKATRYEAALDMVAQSRLGNFQPLSKNAPVIKFYPHLHRELAKVV